MFQSWRFARLGLLSIVVGGVVGAGGCGGDDQPTTLPAEESQEITDANNAMEDYMNSQEKAQ